MGLSKYQSKRDFTKTSEPSGDDPPRGSDRWLFTIQKHQARSLHFDFRLELDGVLKSWAVPKGPSADPSVKRLAVEVEDHPLSYADFEGVIPRGQYGAGSVIVWDTGWWEPEGDAHTGLADGKLYFTLHGKRVGGRWRLVRTKSSGKQPQWLLSKVDDDQADPQLDLTKLHVTSVLSGQSLDQVDQPLPQFIAPKLPSIVSTPPSGEQWIHELKLDGYRMQARWSVEGFSLRTRTGIDWTPRYPNLAAQLSKLNLAGTIMDGELTAIDETGRSDFNALQSSASAVAIPVAYFAFDLLFLRGRDIRQQPLHQRKTKLQELIVHGPASKISQIQFLDHIQHDATGLVEECRRLGLEGTVSKRAERPYVSGRAQDWLKYKQRHRESFVIGGYETNATDVQALSSLLLGYFDERAGAERELQFAGRVGTGWSQSGAQQLIAQLAPHKARSSPFGESIPRARSRAAQTRAHWIKPELTAEVAFAGWTDAGLLRQASFVALSQQNPAHITQRSVSSDSRPAAVVDSDQVSDVDSDVDSDVESDVENDVERVKVPDKSRVARATDLLSSGLSSPDRVLYPNDGITKADVVGYLYQVGQWLLPHVAHRPLSLLRCPQGIQAEQYFQRHPQKGFPDEIDSLASDEESKPLLVLKDMSAVLATAQISALELHPWGCRADRLDRPDRMTIDLDPDETIGWHRVAEAALLVREALAARGLVSLVKTTGGKGLHVVVPLARRASWDKLLEYAHKLAVQLAGDHPRVFVANMSKAKRRDRIYVDYHRNRRGSTAVAAYSLRARPGATVSTPLSWEELPHIMPGQFTIHTVPERLAKLHRDPWEEVEGLQQTLRR